MAITGPGVNNLFPSTGSTIGLNIPIKLTRENFLLWKRQLFPILNCNDLAHILTQDPPVPAGTNSADNMIENPVYQVWRKKDQQVLSLLVSSLSKNVLPCVVGKTTSKEAWEALNKHCSSSNPWRIMHLHNKLHNSSKGTRSIPEYVQDIRRTCNELAAVGYAVQESVSVYALLRGHGPTYSAFNAGITSNLHNLTFEDIVAQINSHDELLSFLNPSSKENTASNFPPMANQAQLSASDWGRGRNSGRNNHGRGRNGGRYTPRCQICGQFGHRAQECRERFNRNFYGWQNPPASSYGQHGSPANPQPSPHAYNLSLPPTTGSSDLNVWYPDSGATHHVTNDHQALIDPTMYQGTEQLQIGNGTGLFIQSTSSSSIPSWSFPLKLQYILHVPAIKKNLLSIYRLTNDNYVYVEFHVDHYIIKEEGTGRPLLKGTVRDGLYLLTRDNQSPVAYAAEKVAMDQWHQRLGHPHFKVLHRIISTYGLPTFSYNKIAPCDACLSSKSHRLPYAIPQHSTRRPLELIHSDLWGPSPVLSHLGHKYYVIFIDDFTRYTWLYPLKLKSDVLNIFTNFHQKVERQFNLKLLQFQSDWGGEFQALSKYLTDCGIHHRLSCPHNPAQNRTAERKHRHIIETALSLLKQASMPHKFWVEAACTAAYLINRMPTPLLKFKSPYQLLFKQYPDYSFLRTFGCLCYPYLRPYAATKLDSRSECCTFLGYSAFHRGYRYISMTSGRIYISRDVIFSETTYPFAAQSMNKSYFTDLPQSEQSILGSSPHDGPRQLLTTEPLKSHQPSSNIPTAPPFHTESSLASPLMIHSDSPDPPDSPNQGSTLNSPFGHIPSSNPLSPTNLDHHTSPSHTRTKSLSAIIQSLDNPPSTHLIRYPLPKCYFVTSNPLLEPQTYHSASKHSHWVKAMQEEYSALHRNQTWSLVPRPSNCPVIGCRWIYNTKFLPNGQVDRFKARLVAKGYHQEGGIDCHETFSPVIKAMTIRLLLSLAINKNWQIRQLDISNAFLHGDLKELISMEQPQGFQDIAFPHHVCRLRKYCTVLSKHRENGIINSPVNSSASVSLVQRLTRPYSFSLPVQFIFSFTWTTS